MQEDHVSTGMAQAVFELRVRWWGADGCRNLHVRIPAGHHIHPGHDPHHAVYIQPEEPGLDVARCWPICSHGG